MTRFVRVQSVVPLRDWVVHVVFTNGEERDIDLLPYIARGPIFEPLRNDPAFFRAIHVEGGTVAWSNGADIDPDVLYYGGAPPWAKDTTTTVVEK